MARLVHVDEARSTALEVMRSFLGGHPEVERAVVLDDLFGRIRIIIWPTAKISKGAVCDELNSQLNQACAQLWTGDIWFAGASSASEDKHIHDTAWAEGFRVDSSDRLRLNDRHRSRTAWFLPTDQVRPQWPLSEGPPVIVFHSFKGGVGRTTALSAYAIARARRGERVAVIDVDLDAPGVGLLLDSDGSGTTARWGVVDFLLEAGADLPLTDYMHTCSREPVTGSGTIEVFPAGTLGDSYLTMLARVDLEVGRDLSRHPLLHLIKRIREERQPSVILLDGRAGLSPAAGLLLSGFAHLHVLFATTNAQTLAGLERVVRHLGFEQARRQLPQGECVVVQAMVPDSTEVAIASQAEFATQVERIFRSGYYAAKPDPEDRLWSLDDLESHVAPHQPLPISYRGKLAFFRTIDQISDLLFQDPDYVKLVARLNERLALPLDED